MRTVTVRYNQSRQNPETKDFIELETEAEEGQEPKVVWIKLSGPGNTIKAAYSDLDILFDLIVDFQEEIERTR